MHIINRWPMACGIVLMLPACVLPQALPFADTPARLAMRGDAQTAQGPFDFGWQLQGDRAVAPLQVFSGSGGVWL